METMTHMSLIPARYGLIAAVLLGIIGIALLRSQAALAATPGTKNCISCSAFAQTVSVDPASYKTWPSGSRTLVDVTWSQDGSKARLSLVNQSSAPTEPFSIKVQVDYHDPLSQSSVSTVNDTYAIPALARQASTTISVPLDYGQCDVFLTLDLGDGLPSVFRTGNPAAC
jgi:hypothetical protein